MVLVKRWLLTSESKKTLNYTFNCKKCLKMAKTSQIIDLKIKSHKQILKDISKNNKLNPSLQNILEYAHEMCIETLEEVKEEINK